VKNIIGFAICIAASANVYAHQQSDHHHKIGVGDSGWFVGGSLGGTQYDNPDIIENYDDESGGYKVFGGYRFNRFLEVEMSVAGLGEYDVYDSGDFKRGEVELFATTANIRGNIPFGHSGLSLYGEVGYGIINVDYTDEYYTSFFGYDESARHVQFGTGLRFTLPRSKRVSFHIGIESYHYDTDEVRHLENDTGRSSQIDTINVGVRVNF